ncbi:hypothetical protein LMG19282_02020 [Cupriavidus campinensis]|nr:hypothetical protein LMG19282_02020 [Cupriavidus campinensis]
MAKGSHGQRLVSVDAALTVRDAVRRNKADIALGGDDAPGIVQREETSFERAVRLDAAVRVVGGTLLAEYGHAARAGVSNLPAYIGQRACVQDRAASIDDDGATGIVELAARNDGRVGCAVLRNRPSGIIQVAGCAECEVICLDPAATIVDGAAIEVQRGAGKRAIAVRHRPGYGDVGRTAREDRAGIIVQLAQMGRRIAGGIDLTVIGQGIRVDPHAAIAANDPALRAARGVARGVLDGTSCGNRQAIAVERHDAAGLIPERRHIHRESATRLHHASGVVDRTC